MQLVVASVYVNVIFPYKCHSNAEKCSVYNVKKSTGFWYNAMETVESQLRNKLPPSLGWSTYRLLSCWYLVWLILWPWRWRWYIPLKCQLTFNRLHSAISQKTVLFITTAVRTSNPTQTAKVSEKNKVAADCFASALFQFRSKYCKLKI
jgi:hypothetical protein